MFVPGGGGGCAALSIVLKWRLIMGTQRRTAALENVSNIFLIYDVLFHLPATHPLQLIITILMCMTRSSLALPDLPPQRTGRGSD